MHEALPSPPAAAARTAVRQWLDSAANGHCGETRLGASCTADASGQFRGVFSTSWAHAAAKCLQACRACERCRFISLALWIGECHWYYDCRAPQPAGGFYFAPLPAAPAAAAVAAAAAAAGGGEGEEAAARLAAPPIRKAVALQVSGHVKSCRLDELKAHLGECRLRFSRCDLFIHTWAAVEPATVHWTGAANARANVSSSACVARLQAELEPVAVRVDVQRGLAEQMAAAAPDGLPFRAHGTASVRFHTERHVGYRWMARGMQYAADLRRDLERREGVKYWLSLRLRPDGHADSRRAGDLAALWDCIHRKTSTYIHSNQSASLELVACSAYEPLGLRGHYTDNCFFGPPAAVDAVLSTLTTDAPAVYRRLRDRNGLLPAQLDASVIATAAALSGVQIRQRAYAPGAQYSASASLSCHIDDMLMLQPPRPTCDFPHGAMLLHFSKSSGTAVCNSAHALGCAIRKLAKNCVVREGLQDGPWWVRRTANLSWWHLANFAPGPRQAERRSCDTRRRLHPSADSFHAVESTLHEGKLCAGFYNFVLLRTPVDRMESHARELSHFKMVPWEQCGDLDALRRASPVAFDQYYIRTLLGRDVWDLPMGAINASHLHAAKELLGQFDAVILSDAPDSERRMRDELGMHFKLPTSSRNRACSFSPEVRSRAALANSLDISLFEFATQLHSRKKTPSCAWHACQKMRRSL